MPVPKALLATSGWGVLSGIADVMRPSLLAGRLALKAPVSMRGLQSLVPRALQGLSMTAMRIARLGQRILERIKGLRTERAPNQGALQIAAEDVGQRRFNVQRMAGTIPDRRGVACSPYPEHMGAEPSGHLEQPPKTWGILNAKDIQEAVEQECARTRQSGKSLSMLRLNLDRVKLDASAPMASAAAMAAASSRFSAQLHALVRSQDCVGKLNDHAFVVLLPDTSARGALRAAERLRTAIASVESSAAGRGATVSIGMVTTRTGRAPYRTLRARADAKCEEASSSGGNRVMP